MFDGINGLHDLGGLHGRLRCGDRKAVRLKLSFEQVTLHGSGGRQQAEPTQRRPHAALDGGIPDMVYFGVPLQREAG